MATFTGSKEVAGRMGKGLMKRLPPYAKQWFEEKPSAGLWVAIGPGAWAFASNKPFPVLVLPSETNPHDYRWPQNKLPSLVFETGEKRDNYLLELVKALMYAGTPSVVAIRESQLRTPEYCTYFAAVPSGE